MYEITLQAPIAANYLAGDTVMLGGFSGTLTEPILAIAGTNKIKVVPDFGNSIELGLNNIEEGKFILINGDFHRVASILGYKDVYEIELTTNINEKHGLEEGVHVLADSIVSEPEIQFMLGNNFVTEWNLENPAENALLNFTVPYSGCNTTFISANCLGFQPDNLISNWVGGNSFNNNWSDGKHINDIYQGVFYPIVKNTSTSDFSLTRSGIDPLNISTWFLGPVGPGEPNPLAGFTNPPESAVYKKKAFYAWISMSNSVSATFFNLANNVKWPHNFGGGFGDASEVRVVAAGSKALVVWLETDGVTYKVFGATVDLGENFGSGGPLLELTTLNNTYPLRPQVAVSGDKALVVWQTHNGVDFDVHSRVFNVATDTLEGTQEQLVPIDSSSHEFLPKVAATGDKALVVWQSVITKQNFGRVFHFNHGATGSFVGTTDIPFAVAVDRIASAPRIAANDHMALVVASTTNLSFAEQDVRTHVFDFQTESKVGATEIVVSTSTVSVALPEVAVAKNGKGIVTWSGGARIFDMINMKPIGDTDFVIDAAAVSPHVTATDGYAIIVWENDFADDINGIRIDLFTNKVIDTVPFKINSGTDRASLPVAIDIGGDVAMVLWRNFDQLAIASRYIKTGFNNGRNNFFVAPLVERDYSVIAKIKL